MNTLFRGLLAATTTFCVSIACAGPVNSIDFEGLASMTYVSGNVVPDSAKLSDQLLSTYGVVFASGDPWVAVVELGTGHATSGVNGIGGSRDGGLLTYDKAYPISFEFFDPKNTSYKATTDFISLRGDLGAGGQLIYLRAYDLFGNQIAETSALDMGGTALTISIAGIHSARFFGTQDMGGVAIDDLTFGELTGISEGNSVPEPSTVIMILPLLVILVIARSCRYFWSPTNKHNG